MSDDYDASNRKHIRLAAKAAGQADRDRKEIIRGIMSVPQGRHWILDLLTTCHVFASSFNDVSARMAFAEGERNIGLRIFNDVLQACPDEYVQMMKEQNDRDTVASARRNNSSLNDTSGDNDSSTDSDQD